MEVFMPTQKNQELEFYYDSLIDHEDYCNRIKEISLIEEMVNKGKKIIIYAPRRYGKSSLIKNIIGKNFKKEKDSLAIYINLMEVQTLDSIAERILEAIKENLKEKYPIKSSFNNLLESIKGLTVSVSVDPITNLPSIDLSPQMGKTKVPLTTIFQVIRDLSTRYKLFLIFDEFQDIQSVAEATGIIRNELQQFKKTPIAILGSKKELLNDMFAKNNSPFFNYGDEIILTPIPEMEWQKYFNDRIFPQTISIEALKYLCEEVLQVPNSISEVGAHLKEHLHNNQSIKEVTIKDIAIVLNEITSKKESTYRFQEGRLKTNEQAILREISKKGFLLKPTEQSVLSSIGISSGTVIKIISRLTSDGWIEHEEGKGYRVSDPLFSYFLKTKG